MLIREKRPHSDPIHALLLGGLTGAAGAVALDDGAGGGIGWSFHGPSPYRNRAGVG